MDRISRLFGKKTEPSGSAEAASNKSDIDQGPRQPIAEVSSPVNSEKPTREASLTPEYGLKFILDDKREFLFTQLPVSIGRGKDNELIVQDPTVSDLHAIVYFDEAVHDVCIVDQDSLNGLCIDGLPTRKNVLHDGVTIQLGAAQICFRDTGYIHSQ
jgi:pSer/pThr/pTyr-binding forkhead associated (FHA) protein